MAQAKRIARIILEGFHNHYQRYQAITAEAGELFARQDWRALQGAARKRISFYDQRVKETVASLEKQFDTDEPDEELWTLIRDRYASLLTFHPQAELAETYYNSVFCKLFHRQYFHNQFIFVESILSRHIPLAVETEFRSYFPVVDGVQQTLKTILSDMGFRADFANIETDIRHITRAFFQQETRSRPDSENGNQQRLSAHQLRLDVLKSPFYRNKAAYIVGRIVTEEKHYPFIVPVLTNAKGQLYADALITDVRQMAIIFSFSRAYFLVNTRAPSALVRFLKDLMPLKGLAELYSSIGFHKQGKTEFYRELLSHLAKSDDKFIPAPGIPGLVMEVFTLPSFPYVFKVIKDEFGESKPFGRETVLERYQLVKKHDRVGRMADTIEYSDVALPRERIPEDLLQRLQQTIGGSLILEDDVVIIRHLYIEKRLTPLNMYLKYCSDEEAETMIADYGEAVKDMMAADIFPGDMLTKNFGVTRTNRVVFYDYDEVQYLREMNFRQLPKAHSDRDMLNDAGHHSTLEGDVFPEQIPMWVFPKQKYRTIFMRLHGELADAEYWKSQQRRVHEGYVADVFPYPQSIRFGQVAKQAAGHAAGDVNCSSSVEPDKAVTDD